MGLLDKANKFRERKRIIENAAGLRENEARLLEAVESFIEENKIARDETARLLSLVKQAYHIGKHSSGNGYDIVPEMFDALTEMYKKS